MKVGNGWNRRKTALCLALTAIFLLLLVTLSGIYMEKWAVDADFSHKNLAPGWSYPFGTDWMGRDMFSRTLAGLSMSIRIGILTAACSCLIAFFMGLAAAMLGRLADSVISGLIDMLLGIPHILLLLLISYGLGKGFSGVVVGISLTHWTSLARVIRGEVIQLRESAYIQTARKLGEGNLKIALLHLAPHLLPQILVGAVLQFPHAILHEASITFLGFGLSPEQPAIGNILSESLKYLSTGSWWLALFPGILLVAVVFLFHTLGDLISHLISPVQSQR